MIIDTKAYRMKYDYHTHTVFSHGKGTIEDNVKVAREKGLSAIAITDHGPGHIFYGIKRNAVPEMDRQIQKLREKYTDINIYLGVEANVVKTRNCLDISQKEYPSYDFVIGGYHYGTIGGYCIRNWLIEHIKLFRTLGEGMKVKNTEMIVKALYENDLKILTHPGDKAPVDMEEVSKACADTDTLMEISTWHANLTVEEIKIAKKTDVGFIISSDAHTPERVGTFEGGLVRAAKAGLDIERIVNIERK